MYTLLVLTSLLTRYTTYRHLGLRGRGAILIIPGKTCTTHVSVSMEHCDVTANRTLSSSIAVETKTDVSPPWYVSQQKPPVDY